MFVEMSEINESKLTLLGEFFSALVIGFQYHQHPRRAVRMSPLDGNITQNCNLIVLQLVLLVIPSITLYGGILLRGVRVVNQAFQFIALRLKSPITAVCSLLASFPGLPTPKMHAIKYIYFKKTYKAIVLVWDGENVN